MRIKNISLQKTNCNQMILIIYLHLNKIKKMKIIQKKQNLIKIQCEKLKIKKFSNNNNNNINFKNKNNNYYQMKIKMINNKLKMKK